MSGMTQQTSDTLSSMSDEDFLKALPSAVEESTQTEESSQQAPAEEQTEEVETQTEVQTPTEESQEQVEGQPEEKVEGEESPAPDEQVQTEEQPQQQPKVEEPNALKEGEEAPKQEEQPKPEAKPATDLQAFHDKILAPFKANGKMLQAKDADEAIQLMQMGANYTRKMQELQPARKTIMLLEKHGLLDEEKLSYLIDLHEKNPEAIKKLVQESGIEPMDIDPNEKSNYVSANHQLSNEEFAFRAAVEEVSTSTNGHETIKAVSGWDQTSQDFIWENPSVLSIIHEQKESGVYDLIVAEVDRRKTMGQIPVNTPFIAAYETVGKEMAEAELAAKKVTEQPKVVVEPKPVVATTVAAPKPAAANGDKAKAASPTRTNGAKAPVVDFSKLSDDEFLKTFKA